MIYLTVDKMSLDRGMELLNVLVKLISNGNRSSDPDVVCGE